LAYFKHFEEDLVKDGVRDNDRVGYSH